MKFIITFILAGIAQIVFSQAAIKVEVSADTVSPGELVKVTYTIENGEGKFNAPEISGLPLVSGPNISSSFMIQNGQKSSSQSYTYVFMPDQEGDIIIPEASYQENGENQSIEPVRITVTSKPNSKPIQGVKEQSNSSKLIREKKKI
jgi:hypothetical protein